MKIDWINSWKKGNKKDTIYDISVRLGRFTILELYCNPKVEHRFMILNFGFELKPQYIVNTELNRCKICKELKPITDFANAGVKKNKRYWRKECRVCFNKKKAGYKKRKKLEYKQWKETLECSQCGYSKKNNEKFVSQHLHLHHIDKKEFNVSDLMKSGLPMTGERFKEEIKNCVVLCGRCHDYEHYKNKQI